MDKIRKDARRIFRYTLADAWEDMISQVEVWRGSIKMLDVYILTDHTV